MRKALVALLAIAGCGSSSDRASVDRYSAEIERNVPRPAGQCTRCNMGVYDGHRCTLTVPCRLCGREHGARHYHEVTWKCDRDGVVMRDVHVCNDSRTCETCLHATNNHTRCLLCTEGRHTNVLARPCDYCHRETPVEKVQGITGYCATCNLEVGANHIHGKSTFCATCLREAGTGHLHDVTRLCMTHELDCAVDHEHGKTEYCQACRRDAGPNHKHGESVWCYRCGVEAPWPHCHHVD
jgi:hypothetical protein